MNKIPFKAVAVDMDGTFVTSDNYYNRKRFDQILTQLHNHHIHFIAASGRPLSRLKEDFAGFMNRIDLITDNGAVLVRDNKIINSHYFTYPTAMKLINFLQSKYPNISIIACGIDNSYVAANSLSGFKKAMRFYYPNYMEINNLSDIPTDARIDKLTVWTNISATELENEFNTGFTEQIHATDSGFKFMDIVPKGVNKAAGLKYFLRYFKIKPEEVIAFGDGMNDYEMLELAGLSYAMENGAPELKKIAKHIAPKNTDEGVFKVLDSYLQ